MGEKLGITERCFLINAYRFYGLSDVEYKGEPYKMVGEIQGNGFVLLLGPNGSEKQGEVLARISDIKPYLHHISTLTENDWRILKNETCPEGTGTFHSDGLHAPMNHFGHIIGFDFMGDIVKWFFENRVDFMNLIDNGYAVPIITDEQ